MPQRLTLQYDYKKLAFIVMLTAIAYNEFVGYFLSASKWPSMQTRATDEGRWKTILLVADPQLQGFEDEPKGPLGWITRWDSDRYLRKNYAWAVYHYSPDVVVFLGDLVDEGSKADDEVFDVYVNRFYSIYPKSSAPKMIFTCGDNDVGGEGAEPVSPERLRRFKSNFPVAKHVSVDPQLDLVDVNVFEMQINSSVTLENWFNDVPKKSGFRFIYSHIPLTYALKSSWTIIKNTDADLIFSAHNHHGAYIRSEQQGVTKAAKRSFFSEDKETPIVINLVREREEKTRSHEISVPTCSYRMGEREMAFGLVFINLEDGYVEYHNLWLPKRFNMLLLYLSALLVTALLLLVHSLCQRKRKKRLRRLSYTGQISRHI